MNLGSKFTIGEAERCARALIGNVGDTVVKLPSHPSGGSIGGEAAFVQLIVSWALQQRSARLQTYLPDNVDAEQSSRLLRRLYGLVAALMGEEIRSIGGSSITEGVQEQALSRLDDLGSNALSYTRGSGVEILCADHRGRNQPPLLYYPGRTIPRLRSREDFASLARVILSRTLSTKLEENISPEGIASIGNFIYELFRNTQDHSLVDIFDNKSTDRSVRGLQVRLHKIPADKTDEAIGDFAPLAEYCEQAAWRQRKGHWFRILEISVFDSGLGFAQRWTHTPLDKLSPSEEAVAVKECFKKNATVKSDDRFGKGLPNVIRRLSARNGFFRIRTGRLSYYADFQKEKADNGIPTFQTWPSEGSPLLPPMRGSLVTTLLPLVPPR